LSNFSAGIGNETVSDGYAFFGVRQVAESLANSGGVRTGGKSLPATEGHVCNGNWMAEKEDSFGRVFVGGGGLSK